MASIDWSERFTGAYATPELVGRVEALEQIDRALRAAPDGPWVIFISGSGGIGKTRLLARALSMAAGHPDLRVADQMIDLYHIPNHTVSGLADSIYEALTPPSDAFRTYELERRELERMRLAGEVAGIGEQRRRTQQVFDESMQSLAGQQRVVLALDTAERLVYGIEQPSAPVTQFADCWDWLVESLPHWRNVLLLIAGRPEAAPLRRWLEQALPGHVLDLELGAFTFEESDAYFASVAAAAEDRGEENVARRVRGLTAETRRLAHLAAGGRPIMLALLVDNLTVVGPSIPPALRGAYTDVAQWTETQLAALRDALEEQLIGRMTGAPEIGDTILALGRLPKGANDTLLAQLLDISEAEASRRLDEIRRLSFVKIRPSDERVFLHDEMYALLHRRVYDRPEDAPEARRAGDTIVTYYRAQIEHYRHELDALFRPIEVEGKSRLDMPRLVEVNQRRRALLVELLFYRLRQEALAGFQLYYRYTREATLAGDNALDVQLQVEMLSFLVERDPQGTQEQIEGLDRATVLSVLAVRPVVRAFADQEFKLVLQYAQLLRREQATLLAAGGPAAEAVLSTWEANALVYLGGPANLDSAYEKLSTVIDSMNQYLASGGDDALPARVWRARATLALACRIRGYLRRVRGLMREAVDDYQQAARLWREVKIKIELASTLNNMAFAMAELGYYGDARALALDALNLRRELGPRSPVGLSLNTLALIDTREGNYKSAIELSDQALLLFRALASPRGIGTALTALSEAERRLSMTGLVPDIDEKIKLLRQAREHAEEALEIFQQLGESSRQADALIEVGCACRDWVRLRRDRPGTRDDVGRLIKRGVEALRRAADTAGEAILYRKVDALVNLAWLGFYADQDDLLDSAAREAEDAIPPEYDVDPATGRPTIAPEQAQQLLWPQLGKLNTLYGHLAFQRYQGIRHTAESELAEQVLGDAAGFYLWSLQYNAMYGEDYRDIRRARDEIYERIKVLMPDELRMIARKVRDVEKDNHLQPVSEIQQFLKRRALWYEPT
jgi:tetratricopeptide (TPR) repeat protein